MENQESSNSGNNQEHYSTDSTTDFFTAMEKQVNGSIAEDNATTTTSSAPVDNTTQPVKATDETQRVNWKKRYEDSSREAKRMFGEMQGLKPYAAIIQAMKNDGGLVEHVRDYLEDGGSSKSIEGKLGLSEDFEFDANELGDPKSDSSKVMNAHVDKLVQQRLQQFGKANQAQMNKKQFVQARKAEEMQFRKDHPDMNDDQYKEMLKQAASHKLSLEDIHYILNKDSANNKVAMNVKKDMVEQMKNARNIPASTSGLNSAPKSTNQTDQIFDALAGTDEGLDDLFG